MDLTTDRLPCQLVGSEMLPGSVGELLIFRASQQRQTLHPRTRKRYKLIVDSDGALGYPSFAGEVRFKRYLESCTTTSVHQSSNKL